MNCSSYDAENVTNSNTAKSSYQSNHSPYCLYQPYCSSYQYDKSCVYHTEDDQSADEQEEYQAYEKTYYGNNLTDTEKAIKKEKKKNLESSWLNKNHNEIVNVSHVIKIHLECCSCCQSFASNNQLHKHLCSDCDYKTMMKATPKSVSKVIISSVLILFKTLSTYVKFNVTNWLSSDSYEFWEWCYATANAQLSFTAENQLICLDTDCIMTLINRQFLMKQTSHTVICCMSSSISVWELSITIHQLSQYIKISIYLLSKDCTVIIEWEIHIIEDLKTKMLVNMNILVTEDIIMNLLWKIAVITSCENIKISLKITIKSTNSVSKAILVKQCTIILSQSNLTVTVIQSKLLDSHNFFLNQIAVRLTSQSMHTLLIMLWLKFMFKTTATHL